MRFSTHIFFRCSSERKFLQHKCHVIKLSAQVMFFMVCTLISKTDNRENKQTNKINWLIRDNSRDELTMMRRLLGDRRRLFWRMSCSSVQKGANTPSCPFAVNINSCIHHLHQAVSYAVVTPLRKTASYELRIAILGIWGDTWLSRGKYGIYVAVRGSYGALTGST